MGVATQEASKPAGYPEEAVAGPGWEWGENGRGLWNTIDWGGEVGWGMEAVQLTGAHTCTQMHTSHIRSFLGLVRAFPLLLLYGKTGIYVVFHSRS